MGCEKTTNDAIKFSYYVLKRTRNCIQLCYKGNNLKNEHARVMVLVHDMLSDCALQMYEVSLRHLLRLSSYRADKKLHCK